MTLNEVLETAAKSQSQGVPVDWQKLCFTVYSVATQEIARLKEEREEEPVIEQEPNEAA